MANSLIPQELDDLIQEYLTDGVLTEKERQVVLRKAEGMGLDRDEIDLYLDAQVQKIDMAIDSAARKQKGKTCPYCGGAVPQLAEKCPHCDEHITAQASEELQEIFDKLEEALVDMKSGREASRSKATVERYARKARMYYGSNPKIQRLLEEIEDEISGTEKRLASEAKKKDFISILKNKVTWAILAAIVFFIIGFGACSRGSDADHRSKDFRAQVEAHPDHHNFGDESLEYTQLREEMIKARDDAGNENIKGGIFILLGVASLGFGVVSSLKRRK